MTVMVTPVFFNELGALCGWSLRPWSTWSSSHYMLGEKILDRKLETIWDFMLEDKNQRG